MTYRVILEFLKNIPLFQAASPVLLQKAVESRHARILDLSAGEQADPCYSTMLGVVLKGSLQILSSDAERPIVLRTVQSGQVFGAASLFLQNEPLSQLTAQNDCTLFFLSRAAIRELLHADSTFLDAYLCFLAERVNFLNAKIRCFTAGSAERRLALWLAEHEENIPFPTASLTALAKTLDIGRASLYRALEKMESESLILRHGREITVLSVEKLLKQYQQ